MVQVISHHVEMLSPPLAWGPEAFKDRHLTTEDGETYKFDPRCPKCVADWANGYNGIIPVIP